MLNQPVAYFAEMRVEFVVVDDSDSASQAFRHGITQIDLLLIGKDILLMGDGLNSGREWTVWLRGEWSGGQDSYQERRNETDEQTRRRVRSRN